MSESIENSVKQLLKKKEILDRIFLCPKCSETLFTQIYYLDSSNIPMVDFTCPQKHHGQVDLTLFFYLFNPSAKEIEDDLTKFDEELEKDIQIHQKNMNKNLKKEENLEKKNKNYQICKGAEFSLFKSNTVIQKKIKLNANIYDILNFQAGKKINKENKDKIKKVEDDDKKFKCQLHHNKNYIGYCLSCKKNICKKCLKEKNHKNMLFENIKLKDNEYAELTKEINKCQEKLNNFKEQCQKITNQNGALFYPSLIYLRLNQDYLNEIKSILEKYNLCLKNKMLNYDIITSVKNIKIKDNIIIPKDMKELINIIKNVKEYLINKDILGNLDKIMNFESLFKNFGNDIDKDLLIHSLLNINFQKGKLTDDPEDDDYYENEEDELEYGELNEEYEDIGNDNNEENNFGDDENDLKEDEKDDNHKNLNKK